MTKVPETMTPEDYFRYICTDDLAKEMFERYITFVEDNIEEVGVLHEQIADLEEEVFNLRGENRTPESEMDDLEDHVQYLTKQLGESK